VRPDYDDAAKIAATDIETLWLQSNKLASIKGLQKLYCAEQGCQMVYFKTKRPILVFFGRHWDGKDGHFVF
jgi:hypothetical protein